MKENIKIFLRDKDIVKEEETSIKEDEVPTEDKDNKKSNETRPTKNAKKSEKNENSEIKMTQEEYSRLSKNARKVYEDKFKEEIMLEKYLSYIKEIETKGRV